MSNRSYRSTRGGGVGIFLNRALFTDFSIKSSSKNFGNIEVVGVNCTTRHINLSLVCIYRPLSSSIIDDQLLFDEIKSLSSLHSNLLIFGDFNFPKISWPNILISDNDGSEGLFKDMLLTTNLAQLVTFPTRFRIGHTPSLLDLILTSDQNLLSKIEQNPPIGVSDHCVIEASIQYFIPSVEKYCIKEFSKINFDNMKFDLASKNWDFLYATGSCGDAWDIFATTISDAMAKNTVKTKIRFNRKKPWITQPFIRRANVKKRLWARYKATGTQADYDQHRNFSNILKQDLKKAKQNYETKLVTSGPKAVFKYVRSKLSTKVSVPIVADKHNKLATSETETANLLADFFESVFTSEPVGSLPSYQRPVTQLLSDISFSEDVVLGELEKLSENCCPGPDGISALVLKRCAIDLAGPLSYIMSCSFKTSTLPSSWRQALITPVFKKGDKTKPENYRPISLTSICCKIMERIIRKHLHLFCEQINIISPNQHGFLPRRSTVTCLLHCINNWTLSLERNIPIDVIYLDFEKAFDRVPHRRLLYKLEIAGIRGLLLRWIEAFLKNRCFSVKVGSLYSTKRTVLSGVPQGSVLGPILFLLYISDLLALIKSSHSFYADDGRLYGNPLENSQAIQDDLQIIHKWTCDWLMPLNNSKCFVLRLGKNNPNTNYTIENHSLKTVREINDLGVLIDKELVFSEHVAHVVKRANIKTYLFQKIFTNPNGDLMKKLFVSYVRPIIEYASVIWSPYLIKDKQLLEKVQRRYTKTVVNLKNKSYENRLTELKLPSLEKRRIVNDLVCTYNILSNKFSINLINIFVMANTSRQRGHTSKLFHEEYKTRWRQNFLTNRVFHLWNNLDEQIVNSRTVNSFKKSLNMHLNDVL